MSMLSVLVKGSAPLYMVPSAKAYHLQPAEINSTKYIVMVSKRVSGNTVKKINVSQPK